MIHYSKKVAFVFHEEERIVDSISIAGSYVRTEEGQSSIHLYNTKIRLNSELLYTMIHELGHYVAYSINPNDFGEERAYQQGWNIIKKFKLSHLIPHLDWLYYHYRDMSQEDIEILERESGTVGADFDYLFIENNRFKYIFLNIYLVLMERLRFKSFRFYLKKKYGKR
jgi:hypothetical protein